VAFCPIRHCSSSIVLEAFLLDVNAANFANVNATLSDICIGNIFLAKMSATVAVAVLAEASLVDANLGIILFAVSFCQRWH